MNLIEKKGTFYNDLKMYNNKTPENFEVIIGSKDILSENPDEFKFEKFDHDEKTTQKLNDNMNKKNINLNEFKEFFHSRIKNKSVDKLTFITPFLNNQSLKEKQKNEIENRIHDLNTRNLKIKDLLRMENLNKHFSELQTTKNENPKKRLDILETDQKEILATFNSNYQNIVILDRKRNNFSVNLDFNRKGLLKETLKDNKIKIKSPNSKKIPQDTKEINIKDKEDLIKIVLDKLPNGEKQNLIEKKKLKANNLDVYQIKIKSSESGEDASNVYNQPEDSINFKNLVNSEKLKFDYDSRAESPLISRKNLVISRDDKTLTKPASKKKSREMNKHSSNRDREKKNNLDLSNHQFKPILISTTINSNTNYSTKNGKVTLTNLNNQIEINKSGVNHQNEKKNEVDNNPILNDNDKDRADIEENIIEMGINSSKNKFNNQHEIISVNSNKNKLNFRILDYSNNELVLNNNDCNLHFLGGRYLESNNQQMLNKSYSRNINNLNQMTHLNPENKLPSPYSYSRNSIKETESFKFSHQSSYDFENNIIEMNSKYKNPNEILKEEKYKIGKLDNSTKYMKIHEFNFTNLNNKIIQKLNLSGFKEQKPNKTLNDTQFIEAKKNIITLNYDVNKKNVKNESKSLLTNKNLINLTMNQTDTDFNEKNINEMSNTVYRNSSENYHNQLPNKDNKHNSNNLFLTNYQLVKIIKVNQNNYNDNNNENYNGNQTKTSMYTINIKRDQLKENKSNSETLNNNSISENVTAEEILKSNDERKETSRLDTDNYYFPEQTDSNMKRLKSKKRDFIINLRESPHIKKMRERIRKRSNENTPVKNIKEVGTAMSNKKTNLNLNLNEQSYINNEVVLNFDSLNIFSPKLKKENDIDNLNNETNILKSPPKIQKTNIINRRISISSTKSFHKSPSLKIPHTKLSFNKKEQSVIRDKNSYSTVRESSEYFLNRDILEEYKKTQLHTRKASVSQIIMSELNFKFNELHGNNLNYANFNDEIIKGKKEGVIILPKI